MYIGGRQHSAALVNIPRTCFSREPRAFLSIDTVFIHDCSNTAGVWQYGGTEAINGGLNTVIRNWKMQIMPGAKLYWYSNAAAAAARNGNKI